MLSWDDDTTPATDKPAVAVKTGRVNAADKRVINGTTDVNQLVPFKYKWAWEKYLTQCANHWMPQEINMDRDIALWKDPKGLTDDERLIVKRNLGFFVTADSLAANNIVLGTYRHITAPECRQFLLRQAFEECHVEGTEVLTSKGFVDFRDLTVEHKVAQYHPTGGIDFAHPTRVIANEYEGVVYEFKNGRGFVSQVVTPGHRMPVTGPEGTEPARFVDAQQVSYSRQAFPVSGTALSNVKGSRFLSPFECFLVAFQADGSFQAGRYRNGNRCGYLTVTFTLTKERKQARLLDLVGSLGFACFAGKADARGRVQYRVQVPLEFPLSKTFDWVDIQSASSDWALDFIEEVKHWDGHEVKNGNGSVVYCSTIKSNTDVVQALAALCGHSTKYNRRVDNRKATFRDNHIVTIAKRRAASRGTVKKTETHYKGNVYCCTVPSGAFIVRHNNAVSVSGNCIHTHAYQYIVESLGIPEAETFNAYNEIASIKAKDEFLIPFIDVLTDPHFKTGTVQADQTLLKSLIAFACVMEGMFFYVGFVQILALGRQNKMIGAAEQFQYILRDESAHCTFGIDLINTVKLENPHLWTPEFKEEIKAMFHKAVELEHAYAVDTMPRGVLGLNAGQFMEYMKFICNRRSNQIGLGTLYEGATNPFPWMSEMMDLKKETNFFERRVTEYQTGGALNWE